MQWDVISTEPLTGYAPESAIGLDVTGPTVYVSGKSLMWEPIAGGTGANFPVNTDITAMEGIPNTLINSTGYALGTLASGTGVAITETSLTMGLPNGEANGIELGFGIGQGAGGAILLSQVGGGSSLSAEGLTANDIICPNNALIGSIQCESTLTCNSISNYTPGTPLTIEGSDGIASGSPNVILSGLVNYVTATQGTVGAAGGASALPATPSLYELKEVNGTKYVSPLYAVS